jgi:F-type H+-transporting ATPase subunit delta
MTANDNNEPSSAIAFDVEARGVARVYATALLKAAQKSGKLDDVLEELRSLVEDVCATQPVFENFLISPSIGRDRRAEALRRALEGKASDLFLNFLLVLNQHDRLNILQPLLLECRILSRKIKGQQYVHVRTAVPLPDDQREKLIQQLRQSMELEPTLLSVVDPEIIGGMIVRIGDWLYDASVRTKLLNIRKHLFESASHEIQSRRDRFSSDT